MNKWSLLTGNLEQLGDVTHLYSKDILAIRYCSSAACLMKHGAHLGHFHGKSPQDLKDWWREKWPLRFKMATAKSKVILNRAADQYKKFYEQLKNYELKLTNATVQDDSMRPAFYYPNI